MKKRETDIPDAHKKTLEWVADPSSPSKFSEWLASDHGIYWIIGKAGSGKSTLMKFMVEYAPVKSLCQAWAEKRKLVMVKYFFWNAGTKLQKSQEGLLRAILFEVLSQCPPLIKIVCAHKLGLEDHVQDADQWSLSDLRSAIRNLQKLPDTDARFCFFIDGLDEFDGPSYEVVQCLEDLQQWPNAKFCVSCRPWNEFLDASVKTAGPSGLHSLLLQDLTFPDIKLYVQNLLEDNSEFKDLSSRDPRGQDLVNEITQKANGVFLWVILVVRSLLTGLQNADSMNYLLRRLRELPPTLEGGFLQMLESVEDIYKAQMAHTFQVALNAHDQLSLLTYSFLDEVEESADEMDCTILKDWNEISARHKRMRKRLNSRCMGLLEVYQGLGHFEDSQTAAYNVPLANFFEHKKHMRPWSESIYPHAFFGYYVDFIHRTARDFLLTAHMQKWLQDLSHASFDVHVWAFKATYAQMKSFNYYDAPIHIHGMWNLLRHWASNAKYIQNRRARDRVIDEMCSLVIEWSKPLIAGRESTTAEVLQAKFFHTVLLHHEVAGYKPKALQQQPALAPVAFSDSLFRACQIAMPLPEAITLVDFVFDNAGGIAIVREPQIFLEILCDHKRGDEVQWHIQVIEKNFKHFIRMGAPLDVPFTRKSSVKVKGTRVSIMNNERCTVRELSDFMLGKKGALRLLEEHESRSSGTHTDTDLWRSFWPFKGWSFR